MSTKAPKLVTLLTIPSSTMPFLEMFQGRHIITELRHDELGTWITPGFQQLLTNILEG
jgi:hypothetical protein